MTYNRRGEVTTIKSFGAFFNSLLLPASSRPEEP
jgi:hypothetical protein